MLDLGQRLGLEEGDDVVRQQLFGIHVLTM